MPSTGGCWGCCGSLKPDSPGARSAPGFPASSNAAAPYPGHPDHMPLRCLLVDDNDAFLKAARNLLERQGMQVAGVASNIAGALRQARALRPDVILVDIGLGEESGFEPGRAAAARGTGRGARRGAADGRGGGADVILISAQAATDYADLIAESPAAGFVPKSELSAHRI